MIATKPIIEIGKEAASELEDLDYISVDIKEADRSISTIMKKAEDAVIRNDARCASFMTGALTADVKSFEKVNYFSQVFPGRFDVQNKLYR